MSLKEKEIKFPLGECLYKKEDVKEAILKLKSHLDSEHNIYDDDWNTIEEEIFGDFKE